MTKTLSMLALRLRIGPQHRVRFAAYGCQMRSLRLAPWQYPPCLINAADIDQLLAGGDDLHGKRTAAQLLRRMLDLGISQYHPDPMAALDAAKRSAA
jgi:hypothetical protein